LPSLLLSPSLRDEEFREYMRQLSRAIAPGDASTLGVADNVMPDSLIDRIEWVTELVEKPGRYPVS
jgi:hypothetical protein